MLDIKVRQMFKKWKLYEREWTFYTTLCYESPVIRLERIFKNKDKHKKHDLIADLYFEYEYEWQALSARAIARLYGVNNHKIWHILDNALCKMKLELAKKSSQGITQNYKYEYTLLARQSENISSYSSLMSLFIV